MAGQSGYVPVVTAFVHSGRRVALIKRSERVGTYRGSWAAFSGYVEKAPLLQARQELREEAGLSPEQVVLDGIGIPLPVDDAASGRRWLVFPFLFELVPGAEIRTDWEAEEWQWYGAGDLKQLDTVPGLPEALRRVWPPFGDREFWHGLEEVATNTELGATALARKGLGVLGGFAQANWDSIDHAGLMDSLRAFAACRPVMGVFPDLAARLLLAINREAGDINFDSLITELLEAVDDATKVSETNAVDALRGASRLLTISYSQTVRDAIEDWRHGDCEVIVAESSPGNEGIALAEYLSGKGIRARTVPDAMVTQAVKLVDAVVVGCDAITDTDGLINKAGTLPMVMAADYAGIPTYAIAQTFKIAPPGWPVYLEHQQMEVSQDGIEVFDITPITRFTAILTEEGPLTTNRLAEIKSELGSVELVPASP